MLKNVIACGPNHLPQLQQTMSSAVPPSVGESVSGDSVLLPVRVKCGSVIAVLWTEQVPRIAVGITAVPKSSGQCQIQTFWGDALQFHVSYSPV